MDVAGRKVPVAELQRANVVHHLPNALSAERRLLQDAMPNVRPHARCPEVVFGQALIAVDANVELPAIAATTVKSVAVLADVSLDLVSLDVSAVSPVATVAVSPDVSAVSRVAVSLDVAVNPVATVAVSRVAVSLDVAVNPVAAVAVSPVAASLDVAANPVAASLDVAVNPVAASPVDAKAEALHAV